MRIASPPMPCAPGTTRWKICVLIFELHLVCFLHRLFELHVLVRQLLDQVINGYELHLFPLAGNEFLFELTFLF